jgi:hypothetical protein
MIKTNNYNNLTPKLCCPFCQKRLWHLGSDQYYDFLFFQNKLSLDYSSWIEEFFCEEHGKLWMQITKQADGTLSGTLAKLTIDLPRYCPIDSAFLCRSSLLNF